MIHATNNVRGVSVALDGSMLLIAVKLLMPYVMCHGNTFIVLTVALIYIRISSILEYYAPIETCVFKENDRRWITLYFKRLIAR
jgi:hypothetical protein